MQKNKDSTTAPSGGALKRIRSLLGFKSQPKLPDTATASPAVNGSHSPEVGRSDQTQRRRRPASPADTAARLETRTRPPATNGRNGAHSRNGATVLPNEQQDREPRSDRSRRSRRSRGGSPSPNGNGVRPAGSSAEAVEHVNGSAPAIEVDSRQLPRDIDWGGVSLSPSVAAALAGMGYEQPSEIQAQSIPPILNGRDVVAQAVTGSGKTASFGIPMCELVDPTSKRVQALVLVPTRELAQQVAREISRIGERRGISVAAVYGGEPINKQIRALERGAPIVIGTPGRIKDHMNRRTLDLGDIRFAVLDEADEMLDIGFADDMEYILRHTPNSRQTALFSATIPGFILRLIRRYLDEPVWVKLASGLSLETVDEVDQIYYEVAERDKPDAMMEVLEEIGPDAQILVFRRMQVGVDRLSRGLSKEGFACQGIHGGMSQSERNSVMQQFRQGSLRMLIATNLAARGLDIPTITHVINYDMPENVEEYVHRIGRTARMGKRGTAISFIGEWDLDVFEKVKEKLGAEKMQRRLLSLYAY